MFTSGDRIDQFPPRVKDFNLQIPEDMPSLLVVGDLRLCGPATATKRFVPLRPSTGNFEVLHGWPARNQDGLLRHQVGSQRPQRRNIVDDSNAAAVSRK